MRTTCIGKGADVDTKHINIRSPPERQALQEVDPKVRTVMARQAHGKMYEQGAGGGGNENVTTTVLGISDDAKVKELGPDSMRIDGTEMPSSSSQ